MKIFVITVVIAVISGSSAVAWVYQISDQPETSAAEQLNLDAARFRAEAERLRKQGDLNHE